MFILVFQHIVNAVILDEILAAITFNIPGLFQVIFNTVPPLCFLCPGSWAHEMSH